jgi:hypothetical protein
MRFERGEGGGHGRGLGRGERGGRGRTSPNIGRIDFSAIDGAVEL